MKTRSTAAIVTTFVLLLSSVWPILIGGWATLCPSGGVDVPVQSSTRLA